MIGFVIVYEEVCLQGGCDLLVDVGYCVFVVVVCMVLVIVEFGIGVGQEVVDIVVDVILVEVMFLIVMVVGFVMQLYVG